MRLSALRTADVTVRGGSRSARDRGGPSLPTSPHRRFGIAPPSALAITWLGIVLLLITAALGLYLVQISLVATSGYERQRLEAERDGWRARNEQLELELAKRRSLVWVEAQAVQRLGMLRPNKPEYLVVDEPAATAGPSTPAVTGAAAAPGH
jgi:hypothetical protein